MKPVLLASSAADYLSKKKGLVVNTKQILDTINLSVDAAEHKGVAVPYGTTEGYVLAVVSNNGELVSDWRPPNDLVNSMNVWTTTNEYLVPPSVVYPVAVNDNSNTVATTGFVNQLLDTVGIADILTTNPISEGNSISFLEQNAKTTLRAQGLFVNSADQTTRYAAYGLSSTMPLSINSSQLTIQAPTNMNEQMTFVKPPQVPDPTEGKDAVNKSYVDTMIGNYSGAGINLYMNVNGNSEYELSNQMSTYVYPPIQTVANPVNPVNATPSPITEIATFVSEPMGLTTIPTGIWAMTLYAYVSSTVGMVQYYFNLSRRRNGVDTLIGTSSDSADINGVNPIKPYTYLTQLFVRTPYTDILSTDSLVIRLYLKTTETVTLHSFFGGDYYSFVTSSLAGGVSILNMNNDFSGVNTFTTLNCTEQMTAPTPALTNSSTTVATTAFVKENLGSTYFTTQADADNSTKIATTGFVKNVLGSTYFITPEDDSNTTKAATTRFVRNALTSTYFITRDTNTNSTQVATTAFVKNVIQEGISTNTLSSAGLITAQNGISVDGAGISVTSGGISTTTLNASGKIKSQLGFESELDVQTTRYKTTHDSNSINFEYYSTAFSPTNDIPFSYSSVGAGSMILRNYNTSPTTFLPNSIQITPKRIGIQTEGSDYIYGLPGQVLASGGDDGHLEWIDAIVDYSQTGLTVSNAYGITTTKLYASGTVNSAALTASGLVTASAGLTVTAIGISTTTLNASDLITATSGITVSGATATFTTYTPQCSIESTIDTELTNKAYVDKNMISYTGNGLSMYFNITGTYPITNPMTSPITYELNPIISPVSASPYATYYTLQTTGTGTQTLIASFVTPQYKSAFNVPEGIWSMVLYGAVSSATGTATYSFQIRKTDSSLQNVGNIGSESSSTIDVNALSSVAPGMYQCSTSIPSYRGIQINYRIKVDIYATVPSGVTLYTYFGGIYSSYMKTTLPITTTNNTWLGVNTFSAGLTSSALITANNGLTVNTYGLTSAELVTAQKGLTVSGAGLTSAALITANAGLTVTAIGISTTTLNASALITANSGVNVSGAGLTVSHSDGISTTKLYTTGAIITSSVIRSSYDGSHVEIGSAHIHIEQGTMYVTALQLDGDGLRMYPTEGIPNRQLNIGDDTNTNRIGSLDIVGATLDNNDTANVLNLGTNQMDGTLNLGTNPARTGAINIGANNCTITIDGAPTINSLVTATAGLTVSGSTATFETYTPRCSVDPTYGDELANKGYVDRLVGNYSGNGLFLYFNIPGPVTNPITTYPISYDLGQTLVPMNASNAATYYTLQTVSLGTSTLIASFTTATGYPNTTTIPAGIWSMLIYGYVSSTTGVLQYHFDVYEVNAAGVNVKQLGSGSTKSTDVNAASASDPDAYHCSLTMPASTLASTTSRIKINIYTTGTSTGSATLYTYFGGDYYSFITTTLSASTALLTANNTWTGTNAFSPGVNTTIIRSSVATTAVSLFDTTTGTITIGSASSTNKIGNLQISAYGINPATVSNAMYVGGAQFVVGAELGLGAGSGRAGPIYVGIGQVAGATTAIGNSVNTNKIGSLTILDAAINPTTTTGTIQLGNLQTGAGVLDIGNNGSRTGAINIGANSCDVNVNGILKTSTPATKINTTQVPTTSWVNTFFATIDSLAGYGGLSTTNTWNLLQTFTSGINVAGTGISVTAGGITTDTLSSTGLITASNGVSVGGSGISVMAGGITTNTLSSTGLITASAGLTVTAIGISTTTLNASALITAQNGLTVTGTGITSNAVNTSSLLVNSVVGTNGQVLGIANNALSWITTSGSGIVNTLDSVCANGAVTSALIVANGGLTVTGIGISTTTLKASGLITANSGVNVSGAGLTSAALITANAGLTVTAIGISTTTLNASSLITANSGVNVSGAGLTSAALITANAGLTVTAIGISTTTLNASNLITATSGLTVSGSTATFATYTPRCSVDPTYGDELANKGYVDRVVGNYSGNGLFLYFNIPGPLATPITTFPISYSLGQTLVSFNPTVAPTAPTPQSFCLQTTALGTSTLIASFTTAAGYPNTTSIPSGIWSMLLYGYVSSETGTLFYHFDVYEVNASGTNIVKLGGDSTKSTDVNAVSASDPDAYHCSLTMPAITLASTTSRIKVNIYTTGTGMAGTVKVNTYLGGEYYSFITTTLSASTALLTANNTWTGTNTFSAGLTSTGLITASNGITTTSIYTTTQVTFGNGIVPICTALPQWDYHLANKNYVDTSVDSYTGNGLRMYFTKPVTFNPNPITASSTYELNPNLLINSYNGTNITGTGAKVLLASFVTEVYSVDTIFPPGWWSIVIYQYSSTNSGTSTYTFTLNQANNVGEIVGNQIGNESISAQNFNSSSAYLTFRSSTYFYTFTIPANTRLRVNLYVTVPTGVTVTTAFGGNFASYIQTPLPITSAPNTWTGKNTFSAGLTSSALITANNGVNVSGAGLTSAALITANAGLTVTAIGISTTTLNASGLITASHANGITTTKLYTTGAIIASSVIRSSYDGSHVEIGSAHIHIEQGTMYVTALQLDGDGLRMYPTEGIPNRQLNIGDDTNTNRIGSLDIVGATLDNNDTANVLNLGTNQMDGTLNLGTNPDRSGAINIGANNCTITIDGAPTINRLITATSGLTVPAGGIWTDVLFSNGRITTNGGMDILDGEKLTVKQNTYDGNMNTTGYFLTETRSTYLSMERYNSITTNTISSTALELTNDGLFIGPAFGIEDKRITIGNGDNTNKIGNLTIIGDTLEHSDTTFDLNLGTNPARTGAINIGANNCTINMGGAPTINSLVTATAGLTVSGSTATFETYTPRCSVDPTYGDELANKGYVDRVVGNYSGNGLFLYFNIPGPITNPITSPLTTQVLGQTLVPMNASNAALYYTLQTTSIGTSTLIASFMTASGYPNTTSIPAGIWSMLIYGYVSSTTGTVFYHFDVYEVDAAGTNIVKKLGGDSTKSNDVNAVTASDPDAYHCSLTMPAVTLDSTTSRIKVNIYVTGAGLAAGTNLFTYFGGTYYSFITSTLSASTALLTANNTWTGTNSFSVSPTAPTAAAGTNTTALATTAFVNASIMLSNPVGTIIMQAGIATPTGYLYCDGTLVSTTTYSQLFAVIGTKYGSGTGTFAVPNFKEKFPLGAANMSTLFSALGNTTGGAFGITLGNLPAHSHTASFTGTNQFVTDLVKIESDGNNKSVASSTPTGRTVATGTVTVQQSAAPTAQYYPPFTTINYFIKF